LHVAQEVLQMDDYRESRPTQPSGTRADSTAGAGMLREIVHAYLGFHILRPVAWVFVSPKPLLVSLQEPSRLPQIVYKASTEAGPREW